LAELGGRPLDSFLVDPAAPAWHDLSVDGGQPGTYEVAARRLEGDAGSEGWVLQLRDVTRERAASVHLQQQERLAAVGQLAAGIAHDFNNIMTAIILFAEKLLMEPGLPPAGPERLNLIVQQGKRAAALIQQILDFSRQSVIEKQPLELVPFMKELDKLLTRILPEHIRLRLSFEPGRYLIHADPARIQQVFMNLAVNARDAMPDGGSLEFALSHYSLGPGLRSPFPGMPEGDWVHIGVTDEGTGIRSEDLPHIFEPFFTTKAPGKGAGLGLAQVYGIVKQHNGYIMATSEAGKGTAFNLYFPGLPVEAPAETSPTPMTLEAGNGETILVVEDDPATRASVSEILRSLNYRVLVASDGQAALRVFHGERQLIDLVLSDVVMPGMGGMQLFRALADQKPEQKILAMTGYPLVEGTKELLGTGTVAWLQKPLGAATLAHTVREVLDGTKP
jgi:signal transduction histidine kinase/CheY-like chemotaxis protein